MYGERVQCSGTLVGPRVVLTAGHCVNGAPPTEVVVGSTDFVSSQGERIPVDEVIEYPDSQRTFDVGLLILRRDAKKEPRTIALDCIVKDWLEDGAPVDIVGWGGTRADGLDYGNHRLNQVRSEIVDANCDDNDLCQPSVSPGGELAGGGGGHNLCFGDSGGPLYLRTDEGEFLAGVASRVWYVDASQPCGEGAIWVRPDAVVGWIDDQVHGLEVRYPSCNVPPEAWSDPIETLRDQPASTEIHVGDLDGTWQNATLAIAQPPEHGVAVVGADHLVTFLPDRGFVGRDSFTVAVTDEGTKNHRTGAPVTVELDVPVTVGPAFLGCACATGGPPLPSALVPLALLVGRRRRRGPGAGRIGSGGQGPGRWDAIRLSSGA